MELPHLNGLEIVNKFFSASEFLGSGNLDPSEGSEPQMTFTTSVLTSMTTGGQRPTPIAAAYYPAWSTDSNPPEKLDFSKFDILFYGKFRNPKSFPSLTSAEAFVTPTEACTIKWDDDGMPALKRLVSSARKSGHGTKIVLSVGMA